MRRLKSNNSNKVVNDSGAKGQFSEYDNAFAAAMIDALDDEDPDEISLEDDIFRSIQDHDVAVLGADFDDQEMADESVHSNSSASSAPKTSAGIASGLLTKFGLPVVEELPDGTKKPDSRRSAFKNFASVPNMKKSKESTRIPKNSLSTSDKSTFSDGYADRPIPTRRLTKNDPLTWRKHASNDDLERDAIHSLDGSKTTATSISMSLLERAKKLAGFSGGGAKKLGIGGGSSRRGSSRTLATFNSSASSFMSSTGGRTPGSSQAHAPPTRPGMPPGEIGRTSSSYEIPMPTMPFETRKATLVRVAMAIIFLCASLTFTLLLGQGQVGTAVSSYLYNNLILGDEGSMADTHVAPESSSNGAHLFPSILDLEADNEANVDGKADLHTPKVTLNGAELEIEVGLQPHEMTAGHYIEYMWLRDVETSEIVLAKEFKPTDDSPPTLRAKVPHGVTLQPSVWCNTHHLWIGEPFKVPDLL